MHSLFNVFSFPTSSACAVFLLWRLFPRRRSGATQRQDGVHRDPCPFSGQRGTLANPLAFRWCGQGRCSPSPCPAPPARAAPVPSSAPSSGFTPCRWLVCQTPRSPDLPCGVTFMPLGEVSVSSREALLTPDSACESDISVALLLKDALPGCGALPGISLKRLEDWSPALLLPLLLRSQLSVSPRQLCAGQRPGHSLPLRPLRCVAVVHAVSSCVPAAVGHPPASPHSV